MNPKINISIFLVLLVLFSCSSEALSPEIIVIDAQIQTAVKDEKFELAAKLKKNKQLLIDLEKAVKDEDYELAAVIKSSIQALDTEKNLNPDTLPNSEPILKKEKTTQKKKEVVETNKYIPNINQLSFKIKNGMEEVMFHGFGLEPNWDIYLTKDFLLYVDPSGKRSMVFLLLNSFNKNKNKQIIKFQHINKEEFEFEIRKEPTGDGMSDEIYPYYVGWKNGKTPGAGYLGVKKGEFKK